MKNQKILDQSLTDNFLWTSPVQIKGAFGNASFHSFGSTSNLSLHSRFKKAFKNICLSKDYFLKRKLQLENFQHENHVPLEFTDITSKKTSEGELITDIILHTPYVESIPVSKFIKQFFEQIRQKDELLLSNFISIIQQMVNIMTFAEKQSIYHFHLNSNSLLLISSDNKLNCEFFLKVTDWGFHNEICSRKETTKTFDFLQKICQSAMFQYLHPELLFEKENLELYQKYKSKYDIWAFGIILYRLAYFTRPFENNGSFSPEKLQMYYKKKQNLQFENPSLLTNLIKKMLSLTEFQTWAQIKNFMIAKAEKVEIDFWSIRQIIAKLIKVLEHMLEIYKLIAWSLHNSANCFWYENKNIMHKFLFYLLKLMLMLRLKFIQRFGHRIFHLSEQQNKKIAEIFYHVECQFKRIQFIEPYHKEQTSFFNTFEKFIDFLAPLQTRIDSFESASKKIDHFQIGIQLRQSWKTLKVLKDFSTQLIGAKNRMQNCNRKIFESLFEIFDKKN